MKTKTLSLRAIIRERKAYAASLEAIRARSAVARAVVADRQRAYGIEAKA